MMEVSLKLLTKVISFLFGAIANVKRPKSLVQLLINLFIKQYKIDISKAKKKSFFSLNDMFTRELEKDFSAFKNESFIHPVEGELVSSGPIEDGQIYLIKGKKYSLKDLIGEEFCEELGDKFNEKGSSLNAGYFYNYYLSPQDYHRVHHPVSGVYKSCTDIKGALYPVAPWFVKLCPSVFKKNYRTVSKVESDAYGTVYTVMVGALNVGSIRMPQGLFANAEVSVKVGDHLGTFELGSSVVVICSKKIETPSPSRVFFDEFIP